jgi:hypothetical protein
MTLGPWHDWTREQWERPGVGANRLVLLFLGLIAFKFANWSWLSDRIPGHLAFLANWLIQAVAFAVFIGLVAVSCRVDLPAWVRRHRPGRLVALAPALLAVLLVLVSISVARALVDNRLLIDDANAMAVCGARAISNGHNPYQVAELRCLRSLNLSPTLATPLRVGSLAKVQGYPTPAEIDAAIRSAEARGGTGSVFSGLGKPPLDPAVMIPVARAPAVARALWTLLAVAIFLGFLAVAAGSLWPAALALFLSTYYIPGSALNFASFGNAEAIAYLLMALSLLWIRRPVLSGVCLGLAIGSNELAFFFLPAYLLICYRLTGRLPRLVSAALTVIIGVAPWLIRYPDALSAIWHNLSAPTFPLGYGPIELVLAGLLKSPPSDLMLGLTALAMALILLWGWRRPEWRIAAGVLLLSAFWLSWRSLDEYMAQIPLLALAAVLALLTNPGQKETAPDQATGEREISAELEAQPGLGGSA